MEAILVILFLCVFYAGLFGTIFLIKKIGAGKDYKELKKDYIEHINSKKFVDKHCKLNLNEVNKEDEVVDYFINENITFKYDNIDKKSKINMNKNIEKQKQTEITDKNSDDELVK